MTLTLALTEVALASLLAMFVFGHVDSPRLARAWWKYYANPTPETEAKFVETKRAASRMNLMLSAGSGLLLAVNSFFLFKASRMATGQKQAGSA